MAQLSRNSKYGKKYLIDLLFALGIVFALLPSTAKAVWRSDPIPFPAKTVKGSVLQSIAVDKNTNQPHIVYGGDALRHAYYDGEQWRFDTVSPSVTGEYISTAVDSNGKVHISYFDSSNLKYATNASGSWVISVVDSAAGSVNSIALDSNDKAHISYCGTGYVLKYATNASGPWVTLVVDGPGSIGLDSSIAVDSADKVHISYYDGTNAYLKYATNSLGPWVVSFIDFDSVGSSNSIATDSNNYAHISYYDSLNDDLKYATNSSGSWVTSTIDNSGNVGSGTSIAMDSSDKVHISYIDITNSTIKHATDSSGPWSAEVVAAGKNSSIAIDLNDNLHVSFSNSANTNVNYAADSTGSWVSSVVDQTISSTFAPDDITGGLNSRAHICGKYNGLLGYVTNISGTWLAETIPGADSFSKCEIAADSRGKAHIIYIDTASAKLKYLTNITGTWNSTEIDNADPTTYSENALITLDADDNVHIAYKNPVEASIKYATNKTGAWANNSIINANLQPKAIRADINGNAYVLYFNNGLYLAVNQTGPWVSSYIPGTSGWGWAAYTIDSNLKIHASQYSSGYTSTSLLYGTNASGIWLAETVDTYPEGWDLFDGGPGSIQIDSNFKAYIMWSVYGDSTYYDGIRYVTNSSGAWTADWFMQHRTGYGPVSFQLSMDPNDKLHYIRNNNGYMTTALEGVSIAAGYEHTLFIKPDGTLWAWGHNDAGQLGDGTTAERLSPVRIGSDKNWAAVSANWRHTMALKQNGTLWAWGDNEYGQVGDGTEIDRLSPVQIGSDTDWASISAGGAHNLALKGNGTLWTWGLNSNGQIGDGTTIARRFPVQVGSDYDWTEISGGWEHSAALKSDNSLYTWGWNEYGQLGDGTTADRHSPVKIGANEWRRVSAGWQHTVAIKTTGTLWAWGDNEYAQLGDGTTTTRLSPVQIGSGADWVSVSAGGAHNLATKADGTLWSWGSNWQGQVGDGTTEIRLAPVKIGNSADWAVVAAGWEHSFGLKTDAVSTETWGWNEYGQLGDGTTTTSLSPININRVKIDGTSLYYFLVQDAYDNSMDGDTVLSRNFTFTGDLIIDRDISVTLEGGYDTAFSTIAGETIINGNMIISDGTVVIEHYILE